VMAVPEEALQKHTLKEIQPIKENKTIDNPPISPDPAILKVDLGGSNESGQSTANTQSKISSLLSQDEKLTHSGRLKIDIAPPSDNEQIEALEKELLQNSNIRIIAKGGAEDGSAWLEIQIKSPMPLVEFLRKSRSVKDVVGAKSYIIVSLHPR
jgi:hypothetical protein